MSLMITQRARRVAAGVAIALAAVWLTCLALMAATVVQDRADSGPAPLTGTDAGLITGPATFDGAPVAP